MATSIKNPAAFNNLEKVFNAYAKLKEDPTKFGITASALHSDDIVIAAILNNKKELGLEEIGDENIKSAIKNATAFVGEGVSQSDALDKLANDEATYKKFDETRKAAEKEATQKVRLLPSPTDYAEVKLLLDAYTKMKNNPGKYGLTEGFEKKELLDTIYTRYADFGFSYAPTPKDLERMYKNAAILSSAKDATKDKTKLEYVMNGLSHESIAEEYMRYKGKQDDSLKNAAQISEAAQADYAASAKENGKIKRKLFGSILGKIGLALAAPLVVVGFPLLGAAGIAGGFAALTSVASMGLVTLAAASGFILYNIFKPVFKRAWQKLGENILESRLRLKPEKNPEKVLGSQANFKLAKENLKKARREFVRQSVLSDAYSSVHSNVLDDLESIYNGVTPETLEEEAERVVETRTRSVSSEEAVRTEEEVAPSPRRVAVNPTELKENEEAFALANQYDECLTVEQKQAYVESVAKVQAEKIVAEIEKSSAAVFTDDQKAVLTQQVLAEVEKQRENKSAPTHVAITVKHNDSKGEEISTDVSLSRGEILTTYNDTAKTKYEENKAKIDSYEGKFDELQAESRDVPAQTRKEYIMEILSQKYGVKVEDLSRDEQADFEELAEKLVIVSSEKDSKKYLQMISSGVPFIDGGKPVNFVEDGGVFDLYIQKLEVYNHDFNDQELQEKAREENRRIKEMYENTIADKLGEYAAFADKDVRKHMISEMVDAWAKEQGLDAEQTAKVKNNVYHYLTDYYTENIKYPARTFEEVTSVKVMKDGKEISVALTADDACARMGLWLSERKAKADQLIAEQTARQKEYAELKKSKKDFGTEFGITQDSVLEIIVEQPLKNPKISDPIKEWLTSEGGLVFDTRKFQEWRAKLTGEKSFTEGNDLAKAMLKKYYESKPDARGVAKSLLLDQYDQTPNDFASGYHAYITHPLLEVMRKRAKAKAASGAEPER